MLTRRAIVLTVSASVALLLAAAVVLPLRSNATWQRMQKEVAALRTALAAEPAARAVLWGEALPGNAHEHYAVAQERARVLQAGHRDELLATLRDSDAQVVERRTVLRQHWQPVLEALRAGSLSADASKPAPGANGTPAEPTNLLDCRWVANAAVFEARALRHEGRGVEAVRRTLDAATLGADLARNGVLIDQMIGCAILTIATSEAWPDRPLQSLDREALDTLAAGLARLDASLPVTLDDRRELLFVAWHIERTAPGADGMPSRADAWRFGFSPQRMVADMFLLQAERAKRLRATRDAPWPVRTAALDGELAIATASGNPLVASWLPNIGAAEGSWREVIVQLRLLRLAVDVHRGVPLPSLTDPIGGGPIAVTKTADGVELTCRPIRQGDTERTSRHIIR